MKFAEPRPYADPEAAMKKLLEIASTVDPFKMGVSNRENQRAVSVRARRQAGRIHGGHDACDRARPALET